MRKKLIQVDFNAWHFICNMQCQYCIQHYDYKVEDNNLLIRKYKNEDYKFYAKIEHLFIRAYKVLKRLNEEYEVGLLTFSGSETFLFEDVFSLIEKLDGMFSKVQLITNGLNLDKTKIAQLKELKNVHITLSLDGHITESNYSRTINDKDKLDKILSNLDCLIEEKIPFDIYTVITKYNANKLETFFKFIENKKPGASIQLWPVFGSNSLTPSKEQLVSLEELTEVYDNFNLKLQPKTYYKYLISYLKSGNREIPCYLPHCSFYLKDNGDIKACLCNGIVDIGNILKDSSEEIVKKQQQEVFYKDILNSYDKLMPCSKCFINWDIINLYFANKISIEDIKSISLLNDKKIISMLEGFKYISEGNSSISAILEQCR